MFKCVVLMELTKSFKCDCQRNITKISSPYLLKTLGKISGGHSDSYCFLKWHKNAFAGIRPNGETIATPSICLYMTWSKMKNDSYAHKVKSFLMSLRCKLWIVLVSENKSLIQMSITSFKATLVKKISTWRLAMR